MSKMCIKWKFAEITSFKNENLVVIWKKICSLPWTFFQLRCVQIDENFGSWTKMFASLYLGGGGGGRGRYRLANILVCELEYSPICIRTFRWYFNPIEWDGISTRCLITVYKVFKLARNTLYIARMLKKDMIIFHR